jgi:hypothetical protein
VWYNATQKSSLYARKSEYLEALIMEQPNSAENRQGTLTRDAQLGWLGGVIDGEGSITVLVTDRSGSKRNTFQISPRVIIANTNAALLDAATRIIKESDLAVYRYDAVVTERTRHQLYHLVVLGWKRVSRFLDVVAPYLVAKRGQAELLRELCQSRLNRGMAAGKNLPYTAREMEIVHLLHKANGTPQRAYANVPTGT